jgi:translation initiation factor 2 beta subunit (eIF-2beta)/eIF-5
MSKKEYKDQLNKKYKRELSEKEFTEIAMKDVNPNKWIDWFLPENVDGYLVIENINVICNGNIYYHDPTFIKNELNNILSEKEKTFLLQVYFTSEQIKYGIRKYHDNSDIVDILLIKWIEVTIRSEGLGGKLLQYVDSYKPKENKRQSI